MFGNNTALIINKAFKNIISVDKVRNNARKTAELKMMGRDGQDHHEQ
jgi:hypothetical protein